MVQASEERRMPRSAVRVRSGGYTGRQAWRDVPKVKRAGKPGRLRSSLGKPCCAPEYSRGSRDLAQTAIPLPLPVQKPEVPPEVSGHTPHLDYALVWDNIM